MAHSIELADTCTQARGGSFGAGDGAVARGGGLCLGTVLLSGPRVQTWRFSCGYEYDFGLGGSAHRKAGSSLLSVSMSNAWAITDELGIGRNSDRVFLDEGVGEKSNELSPPIRRAHSATVLLKGQARTHKPR